MRYVTCRSASCETQGHSTTITSAIRLLAETTAEAVAAEAAVAFVAAAAAVASVGEAAIAAVERKNC